MAEYDVGDLVRSTVVFTNIAGAVTDPTAVTVTYTTPAGVSTTKTYLTDVEVVRDSTGSYHIDLTVSTAGTWFVKWAGTGALVQSEQGIFVVRPDRAVTTLDVVTLDEAKRALNIDVANADFDTELQAWITGISLRLDDLVGPIVRRTVTAEAHDGGRHVITPRRTPVASVSVVTEYDQTTATSLSAESNSSKPGDAYLLDDRDGRHVVAIRRRSSGADAVFAGGRRNVELTYVAGRATTTAMVDQKFKVGAGLMLANLWRREQAGGGNVTWGGATLGDQLSAAGRPTYAVPKAVLELLADELVVPVVGA